MQRERDIWTGRHGKVQRYVFVPFRCERPNTLRPLLLLQSHYNISLPQTHKGWCTCNSTIASTLMLLRYCWRATSVFRCWETEWHWQMSLMFLSNANRRGNISERDISCTGYKGSVTCICILYIVETPKIWKVLTDSNRGSFMNSVKYEISSDKKGNIPRRDMSCQVLKG
jgi:hypothetical protein